MKSAINVELLAFTVPDYVCMNVPALRAVGAADSPRQWGQPDWGAAPPPPAPPPPAPYPVNLPLQMLEPLTLETLCNDFKLAVFERAGKMLPERPSYAPAKPPTSALTAIKNAIWCKKGFASPRHLEDGEVEDLSKAIEQIEAYFKAL